MTLSNGTAAASAAASNGTTTTSKHSLPSHFIGGNRLEAAAPGAVKDFVAKSDGHSVITSVGFSLSPLFKMDHGRRNWAKWMAFLLTVELL